MKRLGPLVLTVALLAALTGCAEPSQDGEVARLQQENDALQAQAAQLQEERDGLRAQVEALEAESARLEDRVAALEEAAEAGGGTPVPLEPALINPRYPQGVGGTEGWRYHQTVTADLDGDGAEETLSVTTNAIWDPERQEYGWDDGHPWSVYVEEPDGTRTYLFSNWVQMGRLEAMVTAGEPRVLILIYQAAGITAYRVAYGGPQQVEAERLMSVGVWSRASFTPESAPR